jgi:hypothetical protein
MPNVWVSPGSRRTRGNVTSQNRVHHSRIQPSVYESPTAVRIGPRYAAAPGSGCVHLADGTDTVDHGARATVAITRTSALNGEVKSGEGPRLTRIRAMRGTCSDWSEVSMVGQLGLRDPVLSGGRASGTGRIRPAQQSGAW